MIVTPIAQTTFHTIPTSVEHTAFSDRVTGLDGTVDYTADIDNLGEFAGRSCYQAWECQNPATAENPGYMNNIIEQGHFSVLEHGSVTFYIEGVSRSLTHELIRHRHLSYSELSQRYVDIEDLPIIVPPAIRDIVGERGDAMIEVLDKMQTNSRNAYRYLVRMLRMNGLKRKEARQAARAVMANMVETRIVVTGNMRAWRDMLYKRHHIAADAEIQELASKVLGHLRYIAPNSVQDISEEPFQ